MPRNSDSSYNKRDGDRDVRSKQTKCSGSDIGPGLQPQLLGLGRNLLVSALRDCVALDDVRAEVHKNYTDNLWWPKSVRDWRTRMVIAGWSTRVSYSHIAHYRDVVAQVSGLKWDDFIGLDDESLRRLVRPLGLPAARLTYLRAVARYVAGQEINQLLARDNAELVEEFANSVEGAGYKVAQCAVLYAKGYHCGIVPIDSGLVEMLSPLVPRRLPSGALAHEVVRRWVERLVIEGEVEIREIALAAGFRDMPSDQPLTWWVHLVLIYYKRLYWNRRRVVGPFRRAPESGGPGAVAAVPVDVSYFPGVLIEGADGAGKSTLASVLQASGFSYLHSPHTPGGDTFERYRLSFSGLDRPVVLDRSFVSEYVYGKIRRGRSRLSMAQCVDLLRMLALRRFVVIHLEEDDEVLRIRRPDEEHDRAAVVAAYRQFFGEISSTIPVFRIVPSKLAPGYLSRLFVAPSEIASLPS